MKDEPYNKLLSINGVQILRYDQKQNKQKMLHEKVWKTIQQLLKDVQRKKFNWNIFAMRTNNSNIDLRTLTSVSFDSIPKWYFFL